MPCSAASTAKPMILTEPASSTSTFSGTSRPWAMPCWCACAIIGRPRDQPGGAARRQRPLVEQPVEGDALAPLVDDVAGAVDVGRRRGRAAGAGRRRVADAGRRPAASRTRSSSSAITCTATWRDRTGRGPARSAPRRLSLSRSARAGSGRRAGRPACMDFGTRDPPPALVRSCRQRARWARPHRRGSVSTRPDSRSRRVTVLDQVGDLAHPQQPRQQQEDQRRRPARRPRGTAPNRPWTPARRRVRSCSSQPVPHAASAAEPRPQEPHHEAQQHGGRAGRRAGARSREYDDTAPTAYAPA